MKLASQTSVVASVLALCSLFSLSATATVPTTTLTFSEVLKIHNNTLKVPNTVGGNLTISTAIGSHLVIVLGELGVSKPFTLRNPLGVDPRINGGEYVTFSFDKVVKLSYWDIDDLRFGSNKFGLSVDGGAAATLSVDSHGPASALVGHAFKFSNKGDAYFIDTLKFTEVAPMTPVSEPETLVMALAGFALIGTLMRRRMR